MRKFWIKKEDARFVLPNACATNIVITNFREFRHIFKLRCAPNSQWEIRMFTDVANIESSRPSSVRRSDELIAEASDEMKQLRWEE